MITWIITSFSVFFGVLTYWTFYNPPGQYRIGAIEMDKQCATEFCTREAMWISIREGNVLGSQAPKRCDICCNAINEAGYNTTK